MEYYNKHFFYLIRHVDPNGMLNVPFNVYTNENCLAKYFKTNKDFRKLDVPWMCDQLILLLSNLDEVFAISSDITFLQNDFQRKKYPFVLFTQAFIGLILIQKNSVKAYFSFCRMSTMALYKNKLVLNKVPRKKKRKKPAVENQSYNEENIPKQQNIMSVNQNEEKSSLESNHNGIDVLLNQPRHIENASEIHQPEIIVPNQTISNIPILLDQNTIYNLNNEENIDFINRRSYSEQLRSQDEKMQYKSIEKQMATPYLQEQLNEMTVMTENQNGLNNPLVKRKRSSKVMKRNFKKRPIEQSSKVLKNRMKKLEGELPDRPLECIAMKYIHQTMNHLPLRYAMYHNKLNVPFAALTLNMELEKNKNQDEVFNNEITMSSYKALTEKFSYSNVSNNCIYQQCINNSLPHLSLVPLAEEYLINNSLEWRNTINEINKKLENSLKDISFTSKSNNSKWQEFKEKMKLRVSQCLVSQKTLIGPELSIIDVPQPLMEFPLPHQIDELLNDKTVTEHQNLKSPFNHVQLNFSHENNTINQIEQNGSQNIQKNDESAEVYHKPSIDILQMISNILPKFSKKNSCLMFTDLCPIHVTNRRYAILVLIELLGMHKKGIIKLHQPLHTADPSFISIELSAGHFF